MKSIAVSVPSVSSVREFEPCRPGSRVLGRSKLGQAWQPHVVEYVHVDETFDLIAAGVRRGLDSRDIFTIVKRTRRVPGYKGQRRHMREDSEFSCLGSWAGSDVIHWAI